jgi:hypothetical protein
VEKNAPLNYKGRTYRTSAPSRLGSALPVSTYII